MPPSISLATRRIGSLAFVLVTVAGLGWTGASAEKTVDTRPTLPLVFTEDFSQGAGRWEPTDPAAWTLGRDGGRAVWGLNRRVSAYQPPVRSPHNIALAKDLNLADVVMTFDVKSTLDTGNHRDCCIFFGHQDPQRFYYVHLGAKPDSHSGQIFIVDSAPRRAITTNDKAVPWNDAWHTVKLVRDSASGSIEVYFDDMEKPFLRAVDTTFGRGRIGIGSFDDRNDFTNVQIHGR